MGPLFVGLVALLHDLFLLLGSIAVVFVLVMVVLLLLVSWSRQQRKQQTIHAMRAYDQVCEEEW